MTTQNETIRAVRDGARAAVELEIAKLTLYFKDEVNLDRERISGLEFKVEHHDRSIAELKAAPRQAPSGIIQKLKFITFISAGTGTAIYTVLSLARLI